MQIHLPVLVFLQHVLCVTTWRNPLVKVCWESNPAWVFGMQTFSHSSNRCQELAVEGAPALVPKAMQAPTGMVDTDSYQERKWAAQPPVVLRLIVQAAPEPIAESAAVPWREGTPVQPEAATPDMDHSLCSTTTQRHSSEEAHDNMLGLAALEQLPGSPPSGPASRQLQEQQIEEVRALQTALSQSEAVFIEVESQLRAAAKKGGRLELGLAAAEERLRQAQAAAAGAEAVQETLQQQLLTEHDKVAELEAELAANNAPVQLVIRYTSSHPDLEVFC